MGSQMKGVLILSVGRSGSNWLGSLTNSTGRMGVSSEWFNPAVFGEDGRELPAEAHILASVEKASTENGFFSIKIFPNQIKRFSDRENIDVVSRLIETYDVKVIRLERQDTFRQAISYARGLQTKQWTSRNKAHGDPEYDFAQLCHCFFLIKKGYNFWQTYTEAREIDDKLFYYEEMIANPNPYVDFISAHAGVEVSSELSSPLRVQRDALTEEWLERFKLDLSKANLAEFVDFEANHKRKRAKKRGLAGKFSQLLMGKHK